MSILNIHTYPDAVLKGTSAAVESIDEDIQSLLEDMAETMYANNGIGLAAPQVGKKLRLIVADVERGENRNSLLKLINPSIVKREGSTRSEEGCLSLPDLIVEVDRAEKVTVGALLPNGQETLIEAEGLLGVCLQHEIDHLEGILLVDRLSSLRRSLYSKKRMKEESKPNDPDEEPRPENPIL
jgi:peptide deformylase